ncbi:hypothetical protein HS088_TW08G00086 [Tripterygium wilfordii]|uniref:Uncharacterized protein n=1 Tax=Tripterygium wilfordii TaxID=458696 RepID=A0A7J7DAW5_TRIWF|nr:uncharacterized protein PAM68-like [Tripterygium wilfordii]KAF5743502.1 hypothetical protein HS088_TW08G00086 [Tripterygium wilfordii]
METLLCSQKPPLHAPQIPPTSEPNTSPILNPTAKQTPTHDPKSWKLQANAKGFAGRSPAKGRPKKPETTVRHRTSEDDDEIPKEVFYRIIKRILVSVGVPMALGLLSLQIFGVIIEQKLWDVPRWVPILATLLTFGSSTIGLAYGALSASLDPEKKGSVLGLEEAQQNWAEMWRDDEERKKR